MEGIGEKVKIVVNRAGLDNGHITLKKAEETIGKEIFWQLPNEYRTMIEARNNGVPLIEQSPKAAITQSIAALAAALFNEAKPRSAGGRQKAFRYRRAFQPLVGQGEVSDAANTCYNRVIAMIDPDQQRHFALDVVRQLRTAEFEAYWAGGCVRDELLGRRPKDYDVATAHAAADPRPVRRQSDPALRRGVRRDHGYGAAAGGHDRSGHVPPGRGI